jgi:hypothetical protein
MMNKEAGKPKDVKREEPVREITVLSNGDIQMYEKFEATTIWDYREFLSYFREFNLEKEHNEKAISDETINKHKSMLENLNAQIQYIKPFIDQAEKITAGIYEENKYQGELARVKDELKNPISDIGAGAWLINVLENLNKPENEDKKKRLWSDLTPEETQKLAKIKLRQMQTNRNKKSK